MQGTNRSLTNLETNILQKLLSYEFQGKEVLEAQLKESHALSTNDSDNYGSIHLITRSTNKAVVSSRVPVEATVNDKDGVKINILLHVVDGFVKELEIFKSDGTPIKQAISIKDLVVKVNE